MACTDQLHSNPFSAACVLKTQELNQNCQQMYLKPVLKINGTPKREGLTTVKLNVLARADVAECRLH
jgi:hypothetical protein